MPYNIWCSSCNNHIGQGVRFNAEKKRLGNYFSTPIWSFRMKCHLCSAWFEIKTDPEHTQYVIVDGAKRQADEWDTSDQGVAQLKGTTFISVLLMVDVKEKEKMEDPFYKLEKDEEDKVKASEQHQIINNLYDKSKRQWSDPWTQSKKLRSTFREEKKVLKAKSMLTEQIRDRNGLHIRLLPESEEDTLKARMIEYDGHQGREAALRRRELKTSALVLGKRGRNTENSKTELERVVKLNTREKADPFLRDNSMKTEPLSLKGAVKVVKRSAVQIVPTASEGLVDGYSSVSE
jgi:coiled-coil domain-containing protein 130